MRERAERRPVAAVADDRRGVREHRVLRHPALRPHVLRQRAQRGHVRPVADRDEEPDRERGEGGDRVAVEAGVVREAARDRAEREVDERPRVAGPRIGRRRRGLRGAEAVHAPARRERRLERRRRRGQRRGAAERVAARVRCEADPLARRGEPGGGPGDRPRLGPLEPERDARGGDPEPLGGERAGELERLADDEVRAPLLDQRERVRQRGVEHQPGEPVGEHPPVRLAERLRAQRRLDRRPRRRVGLGDGRGGEAGALDLRGARALGGDSTSWPASAAARANGSTGRR